MEPPHSSYRFIPTHLILNVSVKSFQHPLTSVLVGQERLHLDGQMDMQAGTPGRGSEVKQARFHSQSTTVYGAEYLTLHQG